MSSMQRFAPHAIAVSTSRVGWEKRYGGAMSIATIDDEPVAGISGPWPDGSFALTWWSTQRFAVLPTLEFHPSMNAAKARVESLTDRLGGAAFMTGHKLH